ncbi:MAG: phosphate acyltransferase PlsX [Thermonemataceae bacterium]|nr:phosphate acyltransferase PlsX [Thermonemataceae bacterium]
MKIALDAMGGDFAPKATIEGAVISAKAYSDLNIVLIGQEATIKPMLKEYGDLPNLHIVHADDVIEMAEHPTKALQQKTNSSIAIGYHLLKEQKVHAFCGAGNTGAMLVGALFSIKAMEGILRPPIISHVPMLDGSTGLLLDVGANTDCKPEVLYQFASLGKVYAQSVLGIENPRIALMNVGEEETKGNLQMQATYPLLKNDASLNFVGNIEGRDLFFGKADVMVCDGFVGNIILKMAESFYDVAKTQKINDKFLNSLNYEAIGGSPILGLNGNVVIGHGISSALAIHNMITIAKKMVESGLNDKIKSSLLAINP